MQNALPKGLAPASADTTTLGGLFSTMLDNNPYFSAGFGLMGVGAAVAVLRKGAVRSANLARRRLLVTLEITSRDPSYLWFLQWMEHQNTRVSTSVPRSFADRISNKLRSHELAVETQTATSANGTSTVSFNLIPGPGMHYFRYKSAWFQVRRERDAKMMDLTVGTPFETVTVTALSRDRALFPELLSEAKELANAARIGRTVIYTAWSTEWRPFGQPRARRLLDSVVLDQGVKEAIVEDVEAFMKRGKWYSERGIPYRRGYLLHGPPGSGKSSFIQALAGSLNLDIAILNLSERGLTDDKLNHLLANAPENTILLLEDVDAAFTGRTQDQGFHTNVTFSGLLNALDGVAASTSQRILFMTTNHAERLDPALIRPGRVDVKALIGDATPYQAGQMFKRFYKESRSPQELESLQQRLEAIVAERAEQGKTISMAALQGHFIRHPPGNAVKYLPLLIDDAQSLHTQKTVTPSMPS